MCFNTVAPRTPSAESSGSSASQPLPALTSHSSSTPSHQTYSEGSVRKRTQRACEVCRRKKVKCNGQKPCNQCIAFAEECNYVDVKDRSAYSRRYVESLEARIANLESNQVQMQRNQDALYQMVTGGMSIPGRSQPTQAVAGQSAQFAGLRRASDPGTGGMGGWIDGRIQRTSQLQLTPIDDGTRLQPQSQLDLASLSAMTLASGATGSCVGSIQDNHPTASSSALTPVYKTESEAEAHQTAAMMERQAQRMSTMATHGASTHMLSNKRFRAATMSHGPAPYPIPSSSRPETAPAQPVMAAFAFGAPAGAHTADAPAPWAAPGKKIQLENPSPGLLLSPDVGFAMPPQSQQQQPPSTLDPQTQQLTLDVQQQQNLMAGLIDQIIHDEQTPTRRAP